MVCRVSGPPFQEEVSNGPKLQFLRCPGRVYLAGLARSRSTYFSDAAVLVKKERGLYSKSTVFDPASSPDWLCGSGQVSYTFSEPQFPHLFSGASGSASLLRL